MNTKQTLVAGALAGFLGVALGAFGAHALKPLLLESGRMDTFELAVRYQFYHALALLFTGLYQRKHSDRLLKIASVCFAGGILLFSGSLYLFSFSNITTFAIATPLGGVLLLGGWLLLLWYFFKRA